MYVLLGTCLALVSFLAVNTCAAAATALLWRAGSFWVNRFSSRARAEILLGLRLMPAVAALAFVALFFVPSYLAYEPHGTAETVSTKMAVFAMISTVAVAVAIWRCARSWLATRSLRRNWMARARQIEICGLSTKTFCIDHPFPIIAVIGIVRPRLFIAERVLRSLTPEELAAAIAHEYGHLKARDNLKRALLRACRDGLVIPIGASLDRHWDEAAEAAADEYAANANPDLALSLASALVRIARMIPFGRRADMPVASFLVGHDSSAIKARVRRLLEIASAHRASPANYFQARTLVALLLLGCIVLAAIVLASNTQLLFGVHLLVENVVSILS